MNKEEIIADQKTDEEHIQCEERPATEQKAMPKNCMNGGQHPNP